MPRIHYKYFRFEYNIDNQLRQMNLGGNPETTYANGNWTRRRVSFRSFTYTRPNDPQPYRVMMEFYTHRSFVEDQDFLAAFERFISGQSLQNSLANIRLQLRDNRNIISTDNANRFTVIDYLLFRRHFFHYNMRRARDQRIVARLDELITFALRDRDFCNMYYNSTALRNTQRVRRVSSQQVTPQRAAASARNLPDIFNLTEVF